jgi:hypothetical protein
MWCKFVFCWMELTMKALLVSVWSPVVYTIVLSLVYLWMTDILSTLSKSSLYTIFLIDLASASSQRRMQMQSGFTSEQCQFLRLFFCPIWFLFQSLDCFYMQHINLGLRWSILVISPLYQAYGDSSFQDCKKASEEAITNVIKNLQV